MVEEMLNTLLAKIPEKYPHLKNPEILRGRIAKVSEGEEWEETIEIADTYGKRKCTLYRKTYRYSIRILDSAGNAHEDFPAVPDVYSREYYPPDSIVAVAMLGGRPEPFILGACV